MKKQLLLLAVVGGALAVAAPQVNAQALPGVYFNPDTYVAPGNNGNVANGTGNTANVITVNGNIPEFIQFNNIDNAIELGNIGGPLWNSAAQGPVRSVQGRSNNSNTGPGFTGVDFVKSTDTGDGAGDAKIEFRANTYVRVKFSGNDLRNDGPDASSTADDTVLPTSYRFSVKGKVKFAAGDTAEANYNNYPGTIGQNPVPPGYGGNYAHYSDPVAAANAADVNFTYAPGAPTNTGADAGGGTATANTDPNAYSGVRFMAEVTRHGLNDYRGAYNTQINLAYYKY